MKIGAEIPLADHNGANGTSASTARQSAAQQSAASSAAHEPNANQEVQKAATATGPAEQELSLSFRTDSNGITYYVLTDPQSGEVVREVPAKEIRQVSGGIEQYLKSQAALAAHQTDSKA